MRSRWSVYSQALTLSSAGCLNINAESFSRILIQMSIINLNRFQISKTKHAHWMRLSARRSFLHNTARLLRLTWRGDPRNKKAPRLALVKNRYFQFKSHYPSKNYCRSNMGVALRVNNTFSSSEPSLEQPHCVILFTLTFTSFNFNSSVLHFPFGWQAL